MSTYKTYIARPIPEYGDPGFETALAAACHINKRLEDAGQASFLAGDEADDSSAYRAMRQELDSCDAHVRALICLEVEYSTFDEE
jgi:hypothetical protein